MTTLSEFQRLMEDEFGSAYAGVIASRLTLPTLDMTAEQALAAGVEPRRVWLDVCQLQGIPPERQWGEDRPIRESSSF